VTRLATLWTVFAAGPIVWLAYLEMSYALVPWACGSGHRALLIVVAMVALALMVASAAVAWGAWRTAGASDATDDAPPHGRNAFMTLSGLGLSLFSALVLLASTVPIFVLSPCD
jgi:hypothetical protein